MWKTHENVIRIITAATEAYKLFSKYCKHSATELHTKSRYSGNGRFKKKVGTD
jgi:hypothetical protein